MQTHEDPIYADHAATTPLRPEVAQAMAECRESGFGNPSSSHRWGRWARRRLDEAREEAAAALGTRPDQVFWTRGGTESANIAILGRVRRAGAGERPVVVASAVEHPAVAEAAKQAEAEGAGRVVVAVEDGELDMDALERALALRPVLVSCMWVNNETGLRLPIEEVAAACRRAGARLHSDGVQAVGKVPVRLDRTPVDMLTVAGHKICGPRSAGALVAPARGFLRPLLHGGGQERGLRPGTEDVEGAAGLALALRLAVAEMSAEASRLTAFRAAVESRLRKRVPGLRVNHGERPRAPHVSSLAVPGADADTLLAALDMAGVAASSGSACASGSHAPRAAHEAHSREDATLRLSFGKLTEEGQMDRIVAATAEAAARARDAGAATLPARHDPAGSGPPAGSGARAQRSPP